MHDVSLFWKERVNLLNGTDCGSQGTSVVVAVERVEQIAILAD